MIKLIFFDFDGVIVESLDIKTKAFTKLFEAEGPDAVKKVTEYHLKNSGVSRYDKFRYIYKKILSRPLGDNEFRALSDRFSKLVVSAVIAAPSVKGTKEFLEEYSPVYKCFLVSATPEEEIKNIVDKRCMTRFFRGVYGSPGKKTDLVKNILLKVRINSDEALYVGDAMSDYIAAGENGVNFVARIIDNEHIFKNIDCPKIKDMRQLKKVIENYDYRFIA
jgi:phosphoglycolate phosphatase-like HAD superfamily hydrolase